jgi:tRNA uridine 5-carbamoylmethylation protein Kti12
MKYLMLSGIPTSGKSTYINKLLENSYWQSAVILSTDNYIARIAEESDTTCNDIFQEYIKEATRQLHLDLQEAIKLNKPIIRDQTNLTIKTRAKKLSNIPGRYQKIIVYFELPLEEALKRNECRPGKSISDAIIKRMFYTFEPPTSEEGFDLVLRSDQELSI